MVIGSPRFFYIMDNAQFRTGLYSPPASPRETKLCIIIDSKTPIIMKVPTSPENLTLGHFKAIASLQDDCYKFYFKANDSEFGVVKEEVTDDNSALPVDGDRIVVWVISSHANQSSLFECESIHDGLEVESNESLYSCNQDLPIPDFDTSSTMKPVPPPLPPQRTDYTSYSRETHSLPRSITPNSLYMTSNIETLPLSGEARLRTDSRSVYEPSASSCLCQFEAPLHCGKDDIRTIYIALRNDTKSLEIRDREWLKVVVKDAFLGSSLVKWLSANVYGFSHRKEVKRYANEMLNHGLIKNPISSGSFSEKCYYTLG